ncbi:MAG: hypothetical protein A2Z14_10705 [Chloroflexi bacterium RBG_16_48_8]|nr:MAG: hypothetical protein A2Z14_10705 [Chloroflexi bacterium RBG_16_48_8]
MMSCFNRNIRLTGVFGVRYSQRGNCKALIRIKQKRLWGFRFYTTLSRFIERNLILGKPLKVF